MLISVKVSQAMPNGHWRVWHEQEGQKDLLLLKTPSFDKALKRARLHRDTFLLTHHLLLDVQVAASVIIEPWLVQPGPEAEAPEAPATLFGRDKTPVIAAIAEIKEL